MSASSSKKGVCDEENSLMSSYMNTLTWNQGEVCTQHAKCEAFWSEKDRGILLTVN